MAFFPMFFDIAGKEVLAVGAGTVGTRRIETLLQFGARVTVISREASETVQRLNREGKLKWIAADYRDCRMAEPFFMVLAATGDDEADALAAEDGRAAHAYVNVAGDKSRSDFYFPGIARAGNVTAGIIADGTDHGLAKRMTARVGKALVDGDAEERQGADGDGQ